MYDPHSHPHPHPHSHHHHRSKRSNTTLASCLIATTFLLLMAVAITVVYFVIFKPKPPKITVNSVQFPSFSLQNNSVNFTFFQFVSVTNPNRDSFTHYDSSLQLAYSHAPVGFIFIPAGRIDGGRTQHMSAKFAVESFPVPAVAPMMEAGGGGIGGDGGVMAVNGGGVTMEIETKMKLVGRVRVLKVFTHRVESGVNCGVAIEVKTGSVLGLHC